MMYEIRLEALAYGGEALGRLPDGRAVFVPFGLPGELVRAEIAEERKNFARGRIVELLEASPERIAPRCKHFTQCGGCHYQHLSYERQLKAKADILRDQLRRIGKIEDPPVRPTVPSPSAWNYRNHVQFHLTADGKTGFVSSQGGEILPIEECHLPEAAIDSFWRNLQFESNEEARRVSLRAGRDGDLLLALESDSPQPPELEIEADVSVVHLFEEHAVTLAGQDDLTIRVLGEDFKVSAASFFQVNTAMAEKMVAYVLRQAPAGGFQLLDIYCGVGLFSKFFAPQARKVVGVESSPSACEDYAENLDEFDNVELYEGTAEDVLPALANQIAGDSFFAVIDPPRAGLERRALDALIHMQPRVIAYVSCDPSTLARDAARLLREGYRLKEVTPFDVFPQTYHIESISIFEKT